MLEKMIQAQTAKQSETLDRWLEKREREQIFPEGVCLTADVPYRNDGAACHKMDIYQPKEGPRPHPVLINLHGGGFLLGRKEVNRLFCAGLCLRGFLVFCPEYPLAPGQTLFTVFRDVSAAIDRICEIAPSYGGDTNRLYLCGDSAGAQLCVYLAAMQNVPELARAAGVTPPRTRIRALGLQSGMFYTDRFDKIGLFLPNSIYGKGWRKHPFRPYINPEHPALLRGLPPCFLVTAKGDFLRHYSQKFAAALRQSGNPLQFLDLEADHDLPHAFAAMIPETPEAQTANTAMAAFFLSQ